MTSATKEEWKPVPKLDNLTEEQNAEWQSKYMVSSLGKIRSNKSKRVLKPTVNKKGYHLLATKLGGRTGKLGNGKNLTVRIHRLVALCFLDNPDNKPEVNHKNGDQSNNTVHNLEWTTPSDNALHSVHVLGNRPKRGAENPLAIVTQQEREYIKLKYKSGHELYGARALGRELGVHHTTILRILEEDN